MLGLGDIVSNMLVSFVHPLWRFLSSHILMQQFFCLKSCCFNSTLRTFFRSMLELTPMALSALALTTISPNLPVLLSSFH